MRRLIPSNLLHNESPLLVWTKPTMSELSSKHINFSAKLMAGILLLDFFFFFFLFLWNHNFQVPNKKKIPHKAPRDGIRASDVALVWSQEFTSREKKEVLKEPQSTSSQNPLATTQSLRTWIMVSFGLREKSQQGTPWNPLPARMDLTRRLQRKLFQKKKVQLG